MSSSLISGYTDRLYPRDRGLSIRRIAPCGALPELTSSRQKSGDPTEPMGGTRVGPRAKSEHLDRMQDQYEQDGRSPASAVRYLRAAARFGHVLHRGRRTLADVDAGRLEAFRAHVSRCPGPLPNGGARPITTWCVEPGGLTLTAGVGELRCCRRHSRRPFDSQQAVAVRWPGIVDVWVGGGSRGCSALCSVPLVPVPMCPVGQPVEGDHGAHDHGSRAH